MNPPPYTPQKKIFGTLFGLTLFILGISLIIIFQIKKNYQSAVFTPSDTSNTSEILFQIENNENVKNITKRLQTEKIIKNDFFFWWYLRSNNLIPNIQAGTHYLSPNLNYEEIAFELSKARPKEVSVTIPEGYTITQIDAKLTEKEFIQAGEFIQATKIFPIDGYDFLKDNSLEGYLFPDTYRLYADHFSIETLITKMLKNFESKIDTIYDIQNTPRKLEEIVIMASILEKETNAKDNRAIVAGILWKRLDSGMMLGADATTRYALDKSTAELTYEDLQSDSPYNTRKHLGLPPGAICNPGLASLKAALNPEDSEYLYYLHDENGDIHYAKTNDEHNANKAKYL